MIINTTAIAASIAVMILRCILFSFQRFGEGIIEHQKAIEINNQANNQAGDESIPEKNPIKTSQATEPL